MYDVTIFKPKVQTAKKFKHSPVRVQVHTTLPNYTVPIVVLSKLHVASHHQTHYNQEYLHQLQVDQHKSDR